MSNNLIKNETTVFYTVEVKDGLYVENCRFNVGRVVDATITNSQERSCKYDRRDTAYKVALYTEGKIIEHTRTEIITETTKRIHVIKEEK